MKNHNNNATAGLWQFSFLDKKKKTQETKEKNVQAKHLIFYNNGLAPCMQKRWPS